MTYDKTSERDGRGRLVKKYVCRELQNVTYSLTHELNDAWMLQQAPDMALV